MLRRHPLLALFASVAMLPASLLAQLSFQAHQIGEPGAGSNIVAHGDFNNDGREDLVVLKLGTSIVDQLYLSNGDGTYGTPITLPSLVQAVGDFNHDGNLDLAIMEAGGGVVSICLGNGNGTFQSPKALPDANVYISNVLAVDLNHDSKTDLIEVLAAESGSISMQLWISNGDGSFTKGQTIVSSTGQLANETTSSVFTGDFDGDGKPDVALVYGFEMVNSRGLPVPGVVQVWYGDGAGKLGSPYLFSDPNGYADIALTVADVNNDGRSDIIAVPGKVTSDGSDAIAALSIFTGNSNRTLSYKTIATSECAGYGSQNIAVADFNGDGLNDLAYEQTSCSTLGGATEIVIRDGTTSGGFGTEQLVYQNTNFASTMDAVRSTLDSPDLVFVQNVTEDTGSLILLSNVTSGAFPDCGLTGIAEGVAVCSPDSPASSPVKFSVAAAGPTPMRTAAVWVDGKKVAEQLTHAFSNYSFLDASLALSSGSHAVTIYGTGWDNTLQQKNFTLDVVGSSSCPAVGNGVNLCSPLSQATVSSPVTVEATSAIPGKLARMEVWIDGVKKYTETTSSSLTYTISLPAGSHRFAVFAVNSTGGKTESFDYATVE